MLCPLWKGVPTGRLCPLLSPFLRYRPSQAQPCAEPSSSPCLGRACGLAVSPEPSASQTQLGPTALPLWVHIPPSDLPTWLCILSSFKKISTSGAWGINRAPGPACSGILGRRNQPFARGLGVHSSLSNHSEDSVVGKHLCTEHSPGAPVMDISSCCCGAACVQIF